jgi:hypothetical protein
LTVAVFNIKCKIFIFALSPGMAPGAKAPDATPTVLVAEVVFDSVFFRRRSAAGFGLSDLCIVSDALDG